jgi:hypothetical protein
VQILDQLTISEDDKLVRFDVKTFSTKFPIHDTLGIIREHITAADIP